MQKKLTKAYEIPYQYQKDNVNRVHGLYAKQRLNDLWISIAKSKKLKKELFSNIMSRLNLAEIIFSATFFLFLFIINSFSVILVLWFFS